MKRYIVLVVGILMLAIEACAPAATATESTAMRTQAITPSPTSSATPTLSASTTPTITPTVTANPSETQPAVFTAAVFAASTSVSPTKTRSAPPAGTDPSVMLPTGTPTATIEREPTGTPFPSATPTIFCPVPTPVPFSVEPVTSPTDQLSQVIVVYIGGGEEVTVVAESGSFTSTGNSSQYAVEIALLPNTVHHLTVFAKVRTVVNYDGCVYGGYTLSTRVDRHGGPLTIVQSGVP